MTDDTINFFSVQPDMVVRLEGNDYFIRGHATEGRFGIDDQPKFWVKYAVDLETGRRIVLKLLFYEDFSARSGLFSSRPGAVRKKKAGYWDMIRGNPHFMQGQTVMDGKGNPVRVIEFIRGKTFYNLVNRMEMDHEAYYFDVLPNCWKSCCPLFRPWPN